MHNVAPKGPLRLRGDFKWARDFAARARTLANLIAPVSLLRAYRVPIDLIWIVKRKLRLPS